MRKTSETSSLKSLASNVLERLEHNKHANVLEPPVARPVSSDTQNIAPQKPYMLQLSSLPDEYEERLAIAEYDGHQNTIQAERIAYLDAFIAVLMTLPYEDSNRDWFSHRINSAQEWLMDQGMEQPK